jgi:hypothetical protein
MQSKKKYPFGGQTVGIFKKMHVKKQVIQDKKIYLDD